MISIKFENYGDGLEQFEAELSNLIGNGNLIKVHGQKFIGIEEINYLLSFGSGLLITQVADIIKTYINRNKNKKVKIGDIEVQGFSKKDIEKLLKKHIEDGK